MLQITSRHDEEIITFLESMILSVITDFLHELKTKNTDTGNDTKTLIPGKSTKQERGTQTPYQNVKQDQNVEKIALERFVIAALYSSTLHCQTSQFTE